MQTVAGALELHYYLADGEHSMNALVRNRCEAELLALFHEVTTSLGVPVEIQAQALAEGGLREAWKWLSENAPQIGIILTVVTLLVAVAPEPESEQEVLDKQLTELQIEEKKLQIEKLRKELREADPRSESTVRESATLLLKNDPKVVVRRSNFFKHLDVYKKVEQIGITPFDANLVPASPERIVLRSNFGKYILTSHVLPPLVDDEARVEVVSPVLQAGNYKWKGIYQQQLIGFSMHDLDFKGQVVREEITFQHGTFLECVLNTHRKLDEVGEVEITGYVVKTVIRKYDDRQAVETVQGKSYRKAKRLRESQQDMFRDCEK